MIDISGLRKTFDGFTALDAATLHAERGAVYGLVGPNGAGKSTLIRCLTGVYRPDAGTVQVDGQPVWENPALKSRIASIPDELFYYLSASTRDMMQFYRGLYPHFDMTRYQTLREVFSTIDERTPLRRLSKGMQKQSAFWLAMCCKPDLLVLDEPVDGLDPVMRRQVWSLLLGDVAEYGTTVLVSSHNLRELEDVCDHVGVMHRGNVILERSLSELQGGVTKLQLVFDGEAPAWPTDVPLLHESNAGRLHTLILRGTAEETTARFASLEPVYMEALPLTLEEIFIYELGGEDYAVKDILL
jgi:ABC-2 type transport system ATP-binding protein